MAGEIKYISKLALGEDENRSIYQLKDSEAREAIDNLFIDEIIIDCGSAPIEEE